MAAFGSAPNSFSYCLYCAPLNASSNAPCGADTAAPHGWSVRTASFEEHNKFCEDNKFWGQQGLRTTTSFKDNKFWGQQVLKKKMEPKSTTNGTNLGQGGGKGQPKINENMKSIKNANVKNQNKKNTCFSNLVRFSQKSEGSTAGRLPRSFQQMWYKCHIKHSTTKSRKNGKVANHHRKNNVFETVGPNGTRITVVSWKAGSAPGRQP